MSRPLKDIWTATVASIQANPTTHIKTALTLIVVEGLSLPDRPSHISAGVWVEMILEAEQGSAGFAQSPRGMLMPTSEDRREQLAIALAMLRDAGYQLSGPGDDQWPVFGEIVE